jgi:hypothetical protein
MRCDAMEVKEGVRRVYKEKKRRYHKWRERIVVIIWKEIIVVMILKNRVRFGSDAVIWKINHLQFLPYVRTARHFFLSKKACRCAGVYTSNRSL